MSYTITIIPSSISNPIPTLIWDLQQEIQMTIIISAHSPSLKLYFWKQVLVPELNRQYNKKFSTYSLSYIIYYASYRVQTKYLRRSGFTRNKNGIQWLEKMGLMQSKWHWLKDVLFSLKWRVSMNVMKMKIPWVHYFFTCFILTTLSDTL